MSWARAIFERKYAFWASTTFFSWEAKLASISYTSPFGTTPPSTNSFTLVNSFLVISNCNFCTAKDSLLNSICKYEFATLRATFSVISSSWYWLARIARLALCNLFTFCNPLYKLTFKFRFIEENWVVKFSKRPVVIFWFKPTFQEWLLPILMFGRKFPIAPFLSISEPAYSNWDCLIEIFISKALFTHASKVHGSCEYWFPEYNTAKNIITNFFIIILDFNCLIPSIVFYLTSFIWFSFIPNFNFISFWNSRN